MHMGIILLDGVIFSIHLSKKALDYIPCWTKTKHFLQNDNHDTTKKKKCYVEELKEKSTG